MWPELQTDGATIAILDVVIVVEVIKPLITAS